MLKGRPAQTNRSKGPGRGRSKPLRRGDQTKAMTVDGVMGRVRGSRRNPRKDEYGKISRRYRRHNWKGFWWRSIKLSILPRPRARRRQHLSSGRSDEYSEGGYGELNGDDLARSHGLVLPRSRGFGDNVWHSNVEMELHRIDVWRCALSPLGRGVVISEGSETTSGKRALDDGSKGKQVTQLPESKRAKINTGASEAPARPPIASGKNSGRGDTPGGQGEGGQAHLRSGGDQGVILGSSLAVRSRDFVENALNQKAVAESAEIEMVRAQNRAIELEGALAEEKAKGKKLSEDADARDKVIARLEARISELERSQSLTRGRIIAAFKESNDFLEAVRGSASSYFGDGFDFCKRQLAHQYPDLGVDLEDVEMDHELLAKEEAEAEKTAAEEGAAGVEGVGEAAV
ncbi:hypothetical protein Acr_28g0000250 [Actinidia rufa]|uniref:Uncharacterized protein n=1 Tax=Actinidia rufa TaxID=165716 RepID=A0A7J0H891_9ERIC|nr:hypothetical protein Acr_28g0000250 [Actinidia rufa]